MLPNMECQRMWVWEFDPSRRLLGTRSIAYSIQVNRRINEIQRAWRVGHACCVWTSAQSETDGRAVPAY